MSMAPALKQYTVNMGYIDQIHGYQGSCNVKVTLRAVTT